MTTKKQGGYKNPPKEHQWQPGQSGNPSGKKKGTKKACQPLTKMLAEELDYNVKVTENGKTKMTPTGRALARTYMRNAIKAPLKQQGEAIKLMHALGVIDLQKMAVEDSDDFEGYFSEEDLRLLKITQDELRESGDWED